MALPEAPALLLNHDRLQGGDEFDLPGLSRLAFSDRFDD
jgi:hypothetical protein